EMTATFLPFTSKGKTYNIMIHTPTNELMEMVGATRSTGVAVLVLFFILSGALVWYLSRLIAKPLINIRRIAMNMAQGDFSTPIDDERDDELGDLAKTMNIMSTRLKNTLESLSRANEELTALLHKWKEFVADVSHELRTPLFLIQGYSEALSDNVVKEPHKKEEYLAVINKETLRLQKLVNDLLDVESGLPVKKVPTDLFNLSIDTVAPFKITASEKKVNIRIDESLKEIGQVNVDPDKFKEVLSNLVDNALRYTAGGGAVTISGQKTSPLEVILQVSDTGTGIPAEHLPHLFDRFYRVDKVRSRASGGTGLGLAIVQKIVEEHGGTITVDSYPGKGTTFTIKFFIN
ncbi:MAG TPA: ATP-binding protein, partial [Desulfobacteria bacterium]|nr:ATP-binding protein [Desulfobacteria bacterium]